MMLEPSWNHVFVPYVSGDVWAGQAPQALNPFAAESNLKGWKGYFQGPSDENIANWLHSTTMS